VEGWEMSKIVARMEKMKIGNLGGIQRHNQRETDHHSNKEIDIERSYLNYDLVNAEPINYREKIHEIIDSQRASKRAVRKDAVLVDEWIITSDRPFFEHADTEKFFQDSLDYFAQRCGIQNIAYATVHLDETTPHMHLGIVPMHEKRLSSKELFTRKSLKEIQEELPHYLQERGHAIERGIKGSEQKHLTVEEYKENQQAIKEMDEILSSKKNELVQVDRQVASQQQAFTNELAQLWEIDWLATMEHSPYFELIYEVRDPSTNEPTKVYIDEHSPIEYRMNFRELIGLFKEKFKQFKEYIANKWQKLTDRGVEIENMSNYLKEKEKGLEAKLERLNAEVSAQTEKSSQMTEYMKKKVAYVSQLAQQSEVGYQLPDYVKQSKLNKDILLVPRDKWVARNIAIDSVQRALAMEQSFIALENKIYALARDTVSGWELKMQNKNLKIRADKLEIEATKYKSALIKLLENGDITAEKLQNLYAPKRQEKTQNRDFDGPSMSL